SWVQGGCKCQNHSSVTEFIILGFSSDPGTQIELFLIFLASFMVLLAVNGLLILVVSFDHHLHKPMYFFLVNLSIIHISSSVAFIPKMLIIFSGGDRRISFVGCTAQVFLNFLLGGCECYSLVFMAYDRYVAICKPLRYNMIMSTSACIWMIVVSWTASSIMSLVDIFFLCSKTFCGPNTVNHFFCNFPSLMILVCDDMSVLIILAFVGSAIVLLLPLLLILFSYYKIIASIKGIRFGRYKAFSSCLPHLIVVTLFYVLAIVIFTKPNSSAEKIVSVFYIIITPILNPIIYCLKNEDVRKALKRMGRLQWSVFTMSYMMANYNVRRRQ
uniref:Olfactory receptor n=1 Tax=Leptobrachium leishanense TaxID=445787 RepID=A0A8C5M855_9ANUR